MTNGDFYVPTHLVNKNYIAIYKRWSELNDKLPKEIEAYVQHRESASASQTLSSFSQRINLERFKQAVGYDEIKNRLGLVFLDDKQQEEFINDFQNQMSKDENSYNSYMLVATGSSFQGFSTNPSSFQELGFMKMCGDTGKTDLDLQLYCSKMRDQALKDSLPLFDNHLRIEENRTQLITFDNESEGDVAPYKYSPWIREFQKYWEKRLSRNFDRTGVLFDGVHIALMTDDTYTGNSNLGSPYVLCNVSP